MSEVPPYPFEHSGVAGSPSNTLAWQELMVYSYSSKH